VADGHYAIFIFAGAFIVAVIDNVAFQVFLINDDGVQVTGIAGWNVTDSDYRPTFFISTAKAFKVIVIQMRLHIVGVNEDAVFVCGVFFRDVTERHKAYIALTKTFGIAMIQMPLRDIRIHDDAFSNFVTF
jgi:hypothetical protein